LLHQRIKDPLKKEILIAAGKSLRLLLNESGQAELQHGLRTILRRMNILLVTYYTQNLKTMFYSVNQVVPTYSEGAVEDTDGRMILRDNFDAIFTNIRSFNFLSEDAGAIGDVNQGLEEGGRVW
jgi:hypothetical protein